MTLGELIVVLVDLDLSDPQLHDQNVAVELDGNEFWIVVG